MTLFQLFLENFLYLRHVGIVVTGKLCSEIVTSAGILGQKLACAQFGVAVVVSPCSVKIVDAVFMSIVNHFRNGGFIHHAVVPVHHGQPHHAKS